MQTVFLIIASIAIIVITIAIVILVRGVLPEIKKIGKASEDLSRVADTLEHEITPAIKDIRETVTNTDILVKNTTQTICRIDRITESVDQLIHSTFIASTANKAIKSSTAGIISVYEGLRKGIKTLRDPNENKEVVKDE